MPQPLSKHVSALEENQRMSIGEEGLGELARSQLEAARRDPRLDRGRTAMVADFWDSMEEVERVRSLGMWGLHELRQSLDREEQRLGVSRTDANLSAGDHASLQAAWERAQLAEAEQVNGHPYLNAQALIGMTSALDAMVEDFVASNRMFMINLAAKRIWTEIAAHQGDSLKDEIRETLLSELRERIAQAIPDAGRLRGHGLSRYEQHLKIIRLDSPPDRPIPSDFAEALVELSALRNVLVHRAGRIDQHALDKAPSLARRYKEGEFVRISREDYGTYSAAVRCYAAEIQFRSIRSWPEVSDEQDGPKLTNWRDYCIVNA